ncbi:hypothetical protein M885DRAFT_578670, partial [Pelagophyceae sp. CCMP2097]
MAAARQGVWLSVDPGQEFSAAYKNMSWAEELGVPLDVFRDLALKAKLIGKHGKGGWGRITTDALIKLGITFHDTKYGKNTTTHLKIAWACAGAAPCHTPLDQIEGNEADVGGPAGGDSTVLDTSGGGGGALLGTAAGGGTGGGGGAGTDDCWEDDSGSDVNYDVNNDSEYDFASASEEDMDEATKRTRGERKTSRTAEGASVVDLEYDGPLSKTDDSALYNLACRKERYTEDGATVLEVPMCPRNGKKRTYFRIAMWSGKQSRRSLTNLGKNVSAALNHVTDGDLVSALAAVAHVEPDAFKKAAEHAHIKMYKRLDVGTGERLLCDANLTFSQYRAIQSILLDSLGVALLPKEEDLRDGIKMRALEVPIVYGDTEMMTNKGVLKPTTYWFVSSLVKVIEKDISSLGIDSIVEFKVLGHSPVDLAALQETVQSEAPDIATLKKEGKFYQYKSFAAWKEADDAAPSPMKHPLNGILVIKSLGDKGDDSFKEGATVANRRAPNSPLNFNLILEMLGAPDNHANLTVLFKEINPDLAALQTSMVVVFASGGTTVAKIIPGSAGLSKADIKLVDFGTAPASEATGKLVDWPAPSGTSKLGIIVQSIGGVRSGVGVGWFGDIADSSSLEAGWYRFDERVEIVDEAHNVVAMATKVFKSGDFAYLAELWGHQGAAAKNPCIWCHATSEEINAGAASGANKRTADSFKANLTAFQADDRKDAGKYHGSVTKSAPGNNAPLKQTAPLILHCFLGQWCLCWEEFLTEIRGKLDGLTQEQVALLTALAEAEAEVDPDRAEKKVLEARVV